MKDKKFIYTYNLLSNEIDVHEVIEEDECKFYLFKYNGQRCGYDTRGASVQHLDHSGGPINEFVLVSTCKRSIGRIKTSIDRALSMKQDYCINAIKMAFK